MKEPRDWESIVGVALLIVLGTLTVILLIVGQVAHYVDVAGVNCP